MSRLAVIAATVAVTFVAALPAGATARQSDSGTRYGVVDLGTLGGQTSFATAINDAGAVVGYAATASGQSHAFLWQHGKLTDLGVLPGGLNSRANAINNRGQIVGASEALTPSEAGSPVVAQQAFLYSHGKMIDLDPNTHLSYTPGSSAYAINDAGQVVGQILAPSADSLPFLYAGGVFSTLPVSGLEPEARAINARGQIVGSTWMDEGPAFLFASGRQTSVGIAPGQALAINDRGMIAGEMKSATGPGHAFLSIAGAVNDLGTLGGPTSQANAVDQRGTAVGTADVAGGSAHAFIYGGGTMQDLNALIPAASAWTLENATGINSHGAIVGVGIHDGAEHAFLLIPRHHVSH